MIKILLIAGVTFLFGFLFFSNWREAWVGSNLFSFALVAGSLFYLDIVGMYAIVKGYYRPSLFVLVILYFLATALCFGRIELVNPLIDALIIATLLAFLGTALIGGILVIYTNGSLFAHLRNWVLACSFMAIAGAIRNYISGR